MPFLFQRLLPLLAAFCLAPSALHAQETAKPSFDPATGTITDARWKSGVPLGGIGVGKIELLTDGGFGNFTNQHNWDRPYGWAKGAFAAVRVQAGDGAPIVKMLRRAGAEEYGGVANVAHTHMQGWFPRAEMVYEDGDLPIQVRLDAFSPLVPHDPKNSALPVACLTYTLTNTTTQPVNASLLLAWPNLLGWGGRTNDGPTVRHWDDLMGDNQSPATAGPLQGLRYATTQTYTDGHQDVIGEYFVGVHSDRSVRVTQCASWDTAAPTPAFWAGFVQRGHLSTVEGAAAKNPAGAVSAETTLAPGQSKALRFYVAWAMPHHVTVQRRATYGTARDLSQEGMAALFDNNLSSRWGTGRPQRSGDSLVLDLGGAQRPTRLTLDQGTAPNDYPRGLRVEASGDGKTWQPVAQMTAAAIETALHTDTAWEVPLTPHSARYLRLTDLGEDSFLWWSIYELSVSVQGQTKPLALPASAATAFLVHSELKDVSEDVGHYWQNWWHSAAEIAQYADKNSARLLAETRAWQDPVRASTLPFWLKLKLINCVFPCIPTRF